MDWEAPPFIAATMLSGRFAHALDRSHFPQRLLIVGGGYIGCEIASILQSLGSRVTLIEKSRLLPDWDEFISTFYFTNSA